MCVIIAKSKKADAPTVDDIRRALITNPDGCALVWANNGTLETFRTLDSKEMINYYIKHFVELNRSAFVFHARIATHGSKSLRNCHGWRTLNGHAAFFHNGILSIRARGDMTDSETFLRDIYEPIALTSGHKKAVGAINAVIGGSKFAFINDEGNIRLYGHYTDIKGVYYSNLNHRIDKPVRHYSYIDYWERFTNKDKELFPCDY